MKAKQTTITEVGDLLLDHETRSISGNKGEVRLMHSEFRFLAALLEDPEGIISHEDLWRSMFGETSTVNTQTLSALSARTRSRISRASGRAWIHHHWGVGFSLIVEQGRAS